MSKKNRELWKQALRSGEFSQGKSTLQSEDGYCCLGVGAQVYHECTGRPVKRDEYGRFEGITLTSEPEIQSWLGLHSAGGSMRHVPLSKLIKYISSVKELPPEKLEHMCLSLWWLNDTAGFTFEEIADFMDEFDEYIFVQEDSTDD